MPHQKHFLKITLLFLKHEKKGKKLVFLVMKTVRAIIKCMIVTDRNYQLILSKK